MKKLLFLSAIILSFGQIIAQKNSVWHKVNIQQTSNLSRVRTNINTESEQYFTLDVNSFKQILSNINGKQSSSVEIEIPNSNGDIERFQVIENSNFVPSFQAQYPQIRAYKGKGITDRSAVINFSVSPRGIETVVFRADNGTEFIEAYDKAASTYVLFNAQNRNRGRLPFNCSTVDNGLTEEVLNELNANKTLSSANTNKTLKLALSCTAEYSNYFGSDATTPDPVPVLAGMNATMTRVNGVMEKDLAVHLNMIDNTNVIYYDPATDPYDPGTTGAAGSWNNQLRTVLHAASYNADGTGDTAFDIGHLFGASGGGGNAGCIGCVCVNTLNGNYKGRGFTSPSDGIPEGDNFDIDYVVHEMGHQLGGNHSFTYGNEGTVAQVEPGSASTIMGYAGITSYDVQPHSDALYAYVNIKQIQTNLNTKTCPVTTPMTANATPVVNAGLDYTIPKGTAFVLTGTASDADSSDVLTYNWEQNDLGGTANVNAGSQVLATKTTGPNFRIWPSSSSLKRYMPQMSRVLANAISVTTSQNTYWETVSTVARTLNFTFTARDNHVGTDYGQTAEDAMVVTVDATKGPLTVTSQAVTGISYPGNSVQTITWAVNSTDTMTGGDMVDILYCTNANSGNLATFNTVLATGLPNNSSATVTIPVGLTSQGRFMVKASNNIFFAVNSKNFSVTAPLATDSFELDNFALFPNPNSGNFTIQFNSTSSNDINVSVYDLRGRSIFEKQYANTGLFNQNIQLNNLQAGIYLVTVKDGDKKVVKKIVIE